jgi:hypothetical protein
MNDLIKELRTTFSIRYLEMPSEASFKRYEAMKLQPEVYADALVHHPAALYEAHRNNLQERGWLVRTISKYLDDPHVWTMDDAANINLVSKKRKRHRIRE